MAGSVGTLYIFDQTRHTQLTLSGPSLYSSGGFSGVGILLSTAQSGSEEYLFLNVSLDVYLQLWSNAYGIVVGLMVLCSS